MRQLGLFSPVQSSTEGIDSDFKSACGGAGGRARCCATAHCAVGQLNDRHKVSSNLLRDDDMRTVEDEGRQFVVVNVPRPSRLQRPVFVGPNPITGS